ncbi:formate dehydrogenase accessory sulfurtransferase FdhD [Thermodesulfobacteriota bacterium]
MISNPTSLEQITNKGNAESFSALRCQNGTCLEFKQELIGEEPLSINVEGKPYAVVMRTPGEEIPHVAGFCLGEGVVDFPDDFAAIGHCEDMDPNVVDVHLKPERIENVSVILDRRGYISQTSCGICGKELIEDICQSLEPIVTDEKINIKEAINCVARLQDSQELYGRTYGSHAVMILNKGLQVLATSEDVGRHNALDKSIGKVFMSRQLEHAYIAATTSRISYELVQKAARARLSIMISKSRPTALAVEMGKRLNMSLACIGKKSGLIILCGKERFIRE